jgi:hypothetical protein
MLGAAAEEFRIFAEQGQTPISLIIVRLEIGSRGPGMDWIMRRLCLAVTVFVLVFSCVRASGATTGPVAATALAVLDSFGAEQLLPQRQRIVRSECSSTITDTALDNQSMSSKSTTELRQSSDGRFDLLKTQWARLKSENSPTPMDQAGSYRELWTGKRYYDYHGSPPKFGMLIVIPNRSRMDLDQDFVKSRIDADLDGVFDGDLVPFTDAVRSAPDLRIDSAPVVVGGDQCIVLLARTTSGSYKVCLDTHHGFVLRAVEVMRRGDDELYGQKMSSMKPALMAGKVRGAVTSHPTEYSFTMDEISIKQIEGHWVPLSATLRSRVVYADRRVIEGTGHVRRTFETFSPDFASVGAFVPSFANGTRVSDPSMGSIRLEWRDGKEQAAIDDETIKSIDRSIDALPAAGLAPATAPNK